jgi:hypothetical protein
METLSQTKRKPQNINAGLFIAAGLLIALPGLGGIYYSANQARLIAEAARNAVPIEGEVLDKRRETIGKGKSRHTLLFLILQTDQKGAKKAQARVSSDLYRAAEEGQRLKIIPDPLGEFDWIVENDLWRQSRPRENFFVGLWAFAGGAALLAAGFLGPRSKALWTLAPEQPERTLQAAALWSVLPLALLCAMPAMIRAGSPNAENIASLWTKFLVFVAGATTLVAFWSGAELVEPRRAPRPDSDAEPDSPALPSQPRKVPEEPPEGASPDPDSPFRRIRYGSFYLSVFAAMIPAWCAWGATTLRLSHWLIAGCLMAAWASFAWIWVAARSMRDALAEAWAVVQGVKPPSASELAGTWRGYIFGSATKPFLMTLESSDGLHAHGSLEVEHVGGKIEKASLAGAYDAELGELAFFKILESQSTDTSFWGLIIGPDSLEGVWQQGKLSGKFFLHREPAALKGAAAALAHSTAKSAANS